MVRRLVLNIKSSNVSNISRIQSLFYIMRGIPNKYKRKLLLSFFLILIAGLFEAETVRYISIILEKLTQIQTSQDIHIPNIGNFSSKSKFILLICNIFGSFKNIYIQDKSQYWIISGKLSCKWNISGISHERFWNKSQWKRRCWYWSHNLSDIKTGALINNMLIVSSAVLLSFLLFSP